MERPCCDPCQHCALGSPRGASWAWQRVNHKFLPSLQHPLFPNLKAQEEVQARKVTQLTIGCIKTIKHNGLIFRRIDYIAPIFRERRNLEHTDKLAKNLWFTLCTLLCWKKFEEQSFLTLLSVQFTSLSLIHFRSCCIALTDIFDF